MKVWLLFSTALVMAAVTGLVAAPPPPTDYMVDWTPKSDLATWSLNTIFFVGDSLVFNYNKSKGIDVQEVLSLAFNECKSENPIWTEGDGETVVHLRVLGPMYFIPSNKHYCEKGLKLEVMVVTNQSVPSSPSGSFRVGDFVRATWKQPWGKTTILSVLVGVLLLIGGAAHFVCKSNCFNNCCNFIYKQKGGNASFNLRQVEPGPPPPAGTDHIPAVHLVFSDKYVAKEDNPLFKGEGLQIENEKIYEDVG